MTIFDDISKKVGSLAQTTVQKSQELAKLAKQNFLISSEEEKIKKVYYEIGKIYYEESGISATGRMAKLCALITVSMDNIKGLREKNNEANAINICPKCGAEVANSNKLCNICGATMPV